MSEMTDVAAEPQPLSSLRTKSLYDGLFNVALLAVVGLFFWAIDFNSHSEVSAAQIMFIVMIPALIIYELVVYLINRRALELEP